METIDTEVLRRQRAKPNKIKSNPVNQPLRTARTFVRHYNGTQYCSRDSFGNIPFLQSKATSQMWPSGGKEETSVILANRLT